MDMTHVPNNILDSLSIDCLIFGFEEGQLKLLLIKRAIEPEKGRWALPGGFIKTDEDIDDAARRILQEMTGVADLFMEQLSSFGKVDRFPLRRVVSIAYYALIKPEKYTITAGPDATAAEWHDITAIDSLPFDHLHMFEDAVARLRRKVRHEPLGFELLPKKFSLTDLQTLYEAILGETLDKRNFRKKLLKMDLLVQLDELQTGVAHRAARLYQFDKTSYEKLTQKGFNFEL